MEAAEARIWIADLRQFEQTHPDDLHGLLDPDERSQAARFRQEADRRAYVVAHAMRRTALAQALGVPAGDIAFSRRPNGKPQLCSPRGARIYFSHSRSRECVTCVVTRAADVGIDVETGRADTGDLGLLARHIDLPDAPHPAADLGEDPPGQFRFYWTALEAFWKAAGQGLADHNPRIRCNRTPQGEYWADTADNGARPRRALLFRVPSPAPSITITAALVANLQRPFEVPHGIVRWTMFHCNSSEEIYGSAIEGRPPKNVRLANMDSSIFVSD